MLQNPIMSSDIQSSIYSSRSGYMILCILKELESKEDVDAKSQLESLRYSAGFNISQLAEILHSQRPTIYEWLEGSEPSPKKQQRLDKIYNLFSGWFNEENLRITLYLYKGWQEDKSLFDLLLEDKINEDLVKKTLRLIKDKLIFQREAETKRESLLQAAGFKPLTKEQKAASLRRVLKKA